MWHPDSEMGGSENRTEPEVELGGASPRPQRGDRAARGTAGRGNKHSGGLTVRLPLLAPFLVACGGSHPTAPAEPIVPPFLFQNATQSEQETAIALWDKESACIGLDPSKAHLVPFTVTTEPMYCGTILAAGCTTSNPPSIKVRREWFSQDQCLPGYAPEQCHAAATELLHLALLLHGENWGYDNEAFGRCI